jgi:hypothetical protein
MSKPEIFNGPIPWVDVERLARDEFVDMVKFVVDLKRRVISAGGGLHSDEEAILLDDGSQKDDLWGANYYWQDETEKRFEYTSMINIRPSQNNLKQEIQSPEIRRQVRELAIYFFESKK